MKSPDEMGRHIKKESVYEERKQAEGENGHRQGEKYENRPEEGIKEPQHECCNKDGRPIIEGDAGNDMGNHEERRAVDDPFDKQIFHTLLHKRFGWPPQGGRARRPLLFHTISVREWRQTKL